MTAIVAARLLSFGPTSFTSEPFHIHSHKRRWKGGSIEPHPTDKALIVNYQLEATVFGDPNNPMLEEKKVSCFLFIFITSFFLYPILSFLFQMIKILFELLCKYSLPTHTEEGLSFLSCVFSFLVCLLKYPF